MNEKLEIMYEIVTTTIETRVIRMARYGLPDNATGEDIAAEHRMWEQDAAKHRGPNRTAEVRVTVRPKPVGSGNGTWPYPKENK